MNALRTTLASALNMRLAAMRNGRSHRKDGDTLNAAIMLAQQFLTSYPFADDARVKTWCRQHRDHVQVLVPGNMPKMLVALMS